MSDLNIARSFYYEFLSYPLFFDESGAGFNDFLSQANYLCKIPIDENDKNEFDNILNFNFNEFKMEQNAVLFDLSYINIPLSASFYDEGRDEGKKRLKVIDILKSSKYRRNSEKCKNSEDHLGFIFILMSTFLRDENELFNELFISTINDFSDEFSKLLFEHKKSNFFKSYSKIFNSFIALERIILGVKAPSFKINMAQIAMNKKPYQTKLPTPKSKIFWDEFTKI